MVRVLTILCCAGGVLVGTIGSAAAAPPTITGLVDRTTSRGSGVGPFLFTVGDDATDPDALVVSASSSNQALVPDATLVLGGSGATRWMSIGVVQGATSPFFDTDILIACPDRSLVTAFRLTFFKEDGTTVQHDTQLLAPASRTTIHVDDIPGMESTSFSTLIETVGANNPDVSIERTMRWGMSSSRYGAHTERAGLGAASRWFFAEGSQGFFFTYFLLVNPAATDNVVHVRISVKARRPSCATIRWRRARGGRSTRATIRRWSTRRSAHASTSTSPAWRSARCTSARRRSSTADTRPRA